MPVFKCDQVIAKYRQTAALFQEVQRLECGEEDFDSPRPIHFFTHNGNDFIQDQCSEWQIGVSAGRDSPNETGADHQFMTIDFCL